MTTGTHEHDDGAAVRLVVVGHVDHGKSTLIGRLFHDTGSLPEGRYEQLVEVARRRGFAFEFANLMDALQAERDQNITIDTAQIWFRAHGRQYVIIDAPGHKEFLKNMVTGASHADAALVIIDAHEGVQEQSRRHGYLLRLLGITQIIVIINKMDLVGHDRGVFERVAADYTSFLDSIGLHPLEVLPVSARHGDNVVDGPGALSWFVGPSALDALRRLAPRTPPVDKPVRLPVQDVYRFDHRRIVVGRLEAGRLTVGDPLVFLPGAKRSAVKSIERWSGGESDYAVAGDSIGITLTEQLFVERGAVASAEDALPMTGTEFRARVFWLGHAPFQPGRSYRLKLTTQETECELLAVERVFDGATLVEMSRERGRVDRHEIGEVSIRTRRPVAFDRYADVPPLGRFVIVDGLDVTGGGIVLAAVDVGSVPIEAGPVLVRSVGHVSRDDRHGRNRHRGAVVWFTGLSGSGKSTLANMLERALFDRGLQVFVLDGDNVRFGLNADLGFSERDRSENIRRVAEVAKLFAEAGLVAVTAFISPYRSDRLRARRIMQEGGLDVPFFEVFLDVPVEVCEARDPKGLYVKARSGELKRFTGISDPYEPPEAPELVLRTAERSVDECVEAILDLLLLGVELRGRGGARGR